MRLEPRKSAARPRPPPHPLASCLTWATCSSKAGLRHRRYLRRRPNPNRTHPPCTCACHAPTTHTTTRAAPNDRHPLSEGVRPSTGMQDYLSQATSTASEPRRSPGAARARPSTPASEGQRPPSPIDALRPLEPPQLPASLSSGGVEGGDSILSPQRGREARDATPQSSCRASMNSMGPVLEQELSVGARRALRLLGFLV